MKALLTETSLPDLLLLTGLGDKPIFSADAFAEESLTHCLEWIAGRRSWNHVAAEAIAKLDWRRAFVARSRAIGAGEKLNDALDVELQRAWTINVERAAENRRRIANLPPPVDAGSLYTEVATIQRETGLIGNPPAQPPSALGDVEHAFDGWSRLEKLAGDADSIVQLVAEHASAQRKTILQSGRQAVDAIFARLETRSAKLDEELLLNALRAVPELVRKSEVALMDKLRTSIDVLSEEFVAELAARTRISVSNLRELHVQGDAALPAALPAFQLTAASQNVLLAEPPALRGLSTATELEQHIAEMAVIVDDLEVGSRWVRIARATSKEELQRLALGIAFTALSRAYMDRDQSRFATELARDAVVALCLPKTWFRQDLFDAAAMALVANRVWARMNLSSQVVGRPSQLISRSDLMFTWLRDQNAVDLVADVWAELPDGVDSCFFDVLVIHLAHEVELRHACAFATLTAARLRSRPSTTTQRVYQLLDPSSRSPDLKAALESCAAELETSSSPDGSARQIIIKQAETIRRLLAGRREDPLAVAIGTRLSDLLIRIASAEGIGGEAKLSVTPNVTTFYPKECSDDVWLPITVANEKSGGPSSELSIHIALEEPSGLWSPEIERAKFVVPPLNPGDSFTGHALLQLKEKAVDHVHAWQFVAELHRGSELLVSQKISVAVRERQHRRANPFGAGQAVGDAQFFVGRETQLRMLLDALCADRRDVTPLIVGLRRIGKTSLLKHFLAQDEVTSRYETHFWDVQDLKDRCTTTQFLTQLASRVRDRLPDAVRNQTRFQRTEFKDDPYLAFENFCDDVARLELRKLVLVGIDEFDHIVRLARQTAERLQKRETGIGPNEALEPQTLGALRKMLMKGGGIRLILCGLPDILSGATYDDRLFGLLHHVDVGPFQESEADRVVDAAEPFVEFPAKVRAQLFDATGLQPYLLQVLCGKVYARVSTSGRNEATTLDLRSAIDREILPNESNFTDYLHLIRPEDRPLLRALALAQKAVLGRRRFVSPGEVLNQLWKAGESWENASAVADRLIELALEERPLVEQSDDHRGNYRLVIGLLTERLVARPT